MRLAIMISLAAFGLGVAAVPADAPVVKCTIGTHVGYIFSATYATQHKADIVASLPDGPAIDGYWTPSEPAVTVADRVFHESLQAAQKDPTQLFPNLGSSDPASSDSVAYQQNELALILANYGDYQRQYLGVVIDSRTYIICNYAIGTDYDPADDYFFIQKIFTRGGKMHFLQCRFDYEWKVCSHVSIVGQWQQQEK